MGTVSGGGWMERSAKPSSDAKLAKSAKNNLVCTVSGGGWMES